MESTGYQPIKTKKADSAPPTGGSGVKNPRKPPHWHNIKTHKPPKNKRVLVYTEIWQIKFQGVDIGIWNGHSFENDDGDEFCHATCWRHIPDMPNIGTM